MFQRKSKTQAGANLRLRLNPEIHVSDNLRIMTQVDILDNVVLGLDDGAGDRSSAGLAALGCYPSRVYTDGSIGFRLAFA